MLTKFPTIFPAEAQSLMLSMFCAASCPRIATELLNNLEPLMESQSGSMVETTALSTVFVVRSAFGGTAATTM